MKRFLSTCNILGNAVPFYRYWNGRDHFYTTNAAEIGTTSKGQHGLHGYTSEGTACHIFTHQVPQSQPLYRYWNGKNHFYTQNWREIGTTTIGVRGAHGYVSEGVAGYCFPSAEVGTVPLYRYYNGEHFYTTNAKEIGTTTHGVVGRHGYRSEGIVCHVMPTRISE